MLIAQISDTHILARTSEHSAAQLRADCLQRCIADINQQRPDAVIFTGDTVQHGTPAEYARLRALLAPLQAPLYPVPGNRDDKDAFRSAFGEQPFWPRNGSFLHYTVEDHAVRLIAIDSTSPGERKGVFCPARVEWLNSVLSEQPDRPTLLFIHHPPFDIGTHYIGGYRRPEEATAIAEVIRRFPHIKALLCGHVHWLVKREWAGTQVRVMPSVAVDLRKGVDETEAKERPIYLLHRLSGENGIVSDVRTVDSGD